LATRQCACVGRRRTGENHRESGFMNISSINNAPAQPAEGVESYGKIKQSFKKLGIALESGNLSDAKEALAQMENSAPTQPDGDINPMKAKAEILIKAVDSGDLKAAQAAYADIKKTVSQHPPGNGRFSVVSPTNGPNKSSSDVAGSSLNTIYDKKDANKDGTVTFKEEQDYNLKHPDEAKQVAAAVQNNASSLDVAV
jgi:hypothetical protein